MPILASEAATERLIHNAHQLQLMAMNLGATYTLAGNIDASARRLATTSGCCFDEFTTASAGSAGFVPVGQNAAYAGTFNGAGFTISSLTINTGQFYAARPGRSDRRHPERRIDRRFRHRSGHQLDRIPAVSANIGGLAGGTAARSRRPTRPARSRSAPALAASSATTKPAAASPTPTPQAPSPSATPQPQGAWPVSTPGRFRTLTRQGRSSAAAASPSP